MKEAATGTQVAQCPVAIFLWILVRDVKTPAALSLQQPIEYGNNFPPAFSRRESAKLRLFGPALNPRQSAFFRLPGLCRGIN